MYSALIKNITTSYGIHALRNKHMVVCHLLSPEQINAGRNPFQLGTRCSALHVDVDESIQKPNANLLLLLEKMPD